MLTAQTGAILKNNTHHLLVIDGGFGKFKHNWNGEEYEVVDLSMLLEAETLTTEGRN
jgi:hypothetical protein